MPDLGYLALTKRRPFEASAHPHLDAPWLHPVHFQGPL